MKYYLDVTSMGGDTYSLECNQRILEDGSKKLLHNEISCLITVKGGEIGMLGGCHIGTEDFSWSDREGRDYAWVLEEYHPGITAQIREHIAETYGAAYSIYQLKDDEALAPIRFVPLEQVCKRGFKVDIRNYDVKYRAPLPWDTSLDDLYRMFNVEVPADFHGHSMSVSDVIVMSRDGKREAFYVDTFGFRSVEFFSQDREGVA